MSKIKNIIKYSINIPIWILSKIIKPNENIWVFGAWFGSKYADNSKYLFEYVCRNHPQIKAVWLSNNEETLKLVKRKGYKAYKTYSLKGYLCTLSAKYGFVSTGFYDINIFACANMKMINLWHGIPLKKIMQDDNITRIAADDNSLYQRAKKFFFPFSFNNYYASIAPSETVCKIYQSAFKNLTEKIELIGQPRCDAFYAPAAKTPFTEKLLNLKQNNKIGIYMPTHRREGRCNFSEFLSYELDNLNEKMKENNVILLIKLHYYHLKEIELQNNKYSNIIFIQDEEIEQDIYSILPLTDFLITDYSSIFFDYLHLNKPVIFFAFDKDDYLKNERAFYFDYEEIICGEKAGSFDELYSKISLVSKGIDNFAEKRRQIHNKFNKYQDGQNCARVVEWIKSLK